MNKEKLIANWDTLKDETKTKILALADKKIKEDYFVPKKGEAYYHYVIVNLACEIMHCNEVYEDTVFDNTLVSLGNCFRTEEEAIFAGNCDYFTKRFETYVNRHTEKLDWNDEEQFKYYAYYSYDYEYVLIMSHTANRIQGAVYASRIQILKDAIADIGKENFLKYVMKVDEGGASWESKAKD